MFSAVWRSRREKRFSSARPGCGWCADRRVTASCPIWSIELEAEIAASWDWTRTPTPTFETGDYATRQSLSRVPDDYRGLRQGLLLLRRSVHARAGTQPRERVGTQGGSTGWPTRATPEIQLLGQSGEFVRGSLSAKRMTFAELLEGRCRLCRESGACALRL